MKCGFIALIGLPNVGKSSLLNEIVNYPLSIASSLVQTTRHQIKGFFNDDESQLIFIDTPGVNKSKQLLAQNLNQKAFATLSDVDLVCFVISMNQKINSQNLELINALKKVRKPKLAIISKIDLGNSEKAKALANELKKLGFDEVVGTSIKIKRSIEHLRDFIKQKMPDQHFLYEQDMISDVSMRFIIQEKIRLATIENTYQEIPHAIKVKIVDLKYISNQKIDVKALIYVERESQKKIVIGAKGQNIKKIGIEARKKIKDNLLLDNNIFLSVKVLKNWTKQKKQVEQI